MSRFVLLHGLAESAHAFDRLAPLLRGRGHAVQALDHPGHGARAAEPGAASIAEMAAAALAKLRGPAVLVGHSMGGQVVVAMAEQAPDCATHLVLVNAVPTVASRLTAHRGGEAMLRRPGVGPALWKGMTRGAARSGLASAFAPGVPVPEPFVDDLMRLSHPTFLRATLAVDDYVRERPLPARLAELAVPSTVVFGEQDQRIDVASLDEYAGAHLVRIAEAGHSPMWETPDRLAAILLDPSISSS